jgi:chlorite dismutase
MDGLVGGAGAALLKEGLLGVIILLEGLVVWTLYKRNETLQTRIEAIQEKRIEATLEDVKDNARVIESNTTSMNGVRQSIDALAMVVRERRPD